MTTHRTVLFVAILLGSVLLARAQDMVPLVAGSTGLVTTVRNGEQDLASSANPILLLPLGKRWLVETEGEFVGDFDHRDGNWRNAFTSSLEYAQFDFFANRYVTVVAGRFLNPFGIFNERLHPTWIRKLQPEPLIHDVEAGSGNGGMLCGALRLV